MTLHQRALNSNKHCYKNDYKRLSGFEFLTYMHPESPAFNPENHTIIIPFSAGVDSWIAYNYALSQHYTNIKLVYINYNHSYANIEYITAQKLLEGCGHNIELLILDNYVPTDKEQESWGEIFPGRNWIIATAVAEKYLNDSKILSAEIWINAVNGELKNLWGDKSKYFFSEGTKILSDYHEKTIILRSPLADLTKGECIAWYNKYYIDNTIFKNKLLETVSCHNISSSEDIPCGECMGCTHRWHGMIVNGIQESYLKDPKYHAEKIYRKYIDLWQFSDMTNKRINEIKTALLI